MKGLHVHFLSCYGERIIMMEGSQLYEKQGSPLHKRVEAHWGLERSSVKGVSTGV